MDENGNFTDKECRYPKQLTKTYSLNEAKKDVALAKKINEKLETLQGMMFLKDRLYLTKEERSEPEKIPKIIEVRLKAAKALAKWNVQAMLRSSRAAVIEHIHGTSMASKNFQINDVKSTETGNIIESIQKSLGKTPKSNVSDYLPKFLSFRKGV